MVMIKLIANYPLTFIQHKSVYAHAKYALCDIKDSLKKLHAQLSKVCIAFIAQTGYGASYFMLTAHLLFFHFS